MTIFRLFNILSFQLFTCKTINKKWITYLPNILTYLHLHDILSHWEFRFIVMILNKVLTIFHVTFTIFDLVGKISIFKVEVQYVAQLSWQILGILQNCVNNVSIKLPTALLSSTIHYTSTRRTISHLCMIKMQTKLNI